MGAKISVLVVNLNNLSYTKQCLGDLLNQDIVFNLRLVDQNSSELGTKEFFDDFFTKHSNGEFYGKIDYLEISNTGFNKPLNHLWNDYVKESSTEFICLLNNDVRISPNFLSSAISVLEKEQSVGFVNHVTNNSAYSSWSDSLEYVIMETPYRQGWDPIFRKSCYNPIPDELKFFYGDDYIYSKLYSLGYKGAYILNSPMIHLERSTTTEKGGARDCSLDGDFFSSLDLDYKNLTFNEDLCRWKPEFTSLSAKNKIMEHFYYDIGEDWFDYQDLYTEMVNKFSDGSNFVEVGSWKGRSSVYMAVEIINSNKNIKFDCVDVWEYVDTQNDIPVGSFDGLYFNFLKNIRPVKSFINPIKMTSELASFLYDNNSLDFIFIDAAHDYDNVINDIKNWLPKLKPGGCIAGHDYFTSEGIQKAVKEVFGNRYTLFGSCWLYENRYFGATLQEIGMKNSTDKATHHNFLDFYESKIGHLKDNRINLLEIGFLHGNSIRTWLEYFNNAEVYCIDVLDIDFKHERFHYFKISQEDENLKLLFEDSFFDVIIDDGSHITSHQIKSIEYLWSKLKKSGFYILEDLHTSFRPEYIDTDITTYEFVSGEKEVDSLKDIKNQIQEVDIFRRIPGSNWDSVTSVIKK